MGKDTPKLYEVELWVRKAETITFAVNISSGSHLQITWAMDTDADICKNFAGKPCHFPFKLNGAMFYGCTSDRSSHLNWQKTSDNICSIQNDDYFNLINHGNCNMLYCHRQGTISNSNLELNKKAPNFISAAKVDGSEVTNSSSLQGGSQIIETNEFTAPLSTQLILKRTFDTPGKTYTIKLKAQNLHTKGDVSILTWVATCGNPIISSYWSMEFPEFIRPGGTVSIKLWIKPDVPLPTKPVLRIVKHSGERVLNSPAEIDNSSAIPFFITHDLTEPVENCFETPEKCVTEMKFENMGVEPNTQSGTNGSLGSDYGTMILATLAFDSKESKGGSYGFSVQFYNGISRIWQDFEADGVTVTENITVLDPAPLGTGQWETIVSTKWQKNWVESFAPIIGPVLTTLQYSLMGSSQLYDAEFQEGIWYIPAAAFPHFIVSIYKGTVRRAQCTVNNTDLEGYQPPPCFVDWPEGAMTGTTSWKISHCMNIVSCGNTNLIQ